MVERIELFGGVRVVTAEHNHFALDGETDLPPEVWCWSLEKLSAVATSRSAISASCRVLVQSTRHRNLYNGRLILL